MTTLNYQLIAKIKEVRSIETTLLNINYEHLGKVLEAKQRKLNNELISYDRKNS